MKRVCFFGIYDENYARNRILMKGFARNGFEVCACRVPASGSGILKYFYLYKEYRKIRKINMDFVVVAFPGQTVAWLARILFGKNIILDAFLSLYDTNVFDRKICKPLSLKALASWFWDWSSCHLSKIILLDTFAHIDYFSKTFFISKDRFVKVPIGADDEIFYPRPTETVSSENEICFHGNYIPLQGIEFIVEAASILEKEPVHFTFVGSGQMFEKIKSKIKELRLEDKIKIIGRVSPEKVPDLILKSKICLGIFGSTPKTKRVIPNKVYECMAMRKPVITADTEAARESFANGKDVVFCELANGSDLAGKILELIKNPSLMDRVAQGGFDHFKKEFTPEIIVRSLLEKINWHK